MASGTARPERLTTSSGVLCLLGVLYLLQELGRAWLETRAVASQIPSGVSAGGWLDMSGAAWLARWLYVGAHIWVAVVAVRWARGLRVTPTNRLLLFVLCGGLAGVHVLALGPMRGWTTRPWIF
jgi:hypothetical protein